MLITPMFTFDLKGLKSDEMQQALKWFVTLLCLQLNKMAGVETAIPVSTGVTELSSLIVLN